MRQKPPFPALAWEGPLGKTSLDALWAEWTSADSTFPSSCEAMAPEGLVRTSTQVPASPSPRGPRGLHRGAVERRAPSLLCQPMLGSRCPASLTPALRLLHSGGWRLNLSVRPTLSHLCQPRLRLSELSEH